MKNRTRIPLTTLETNILCIMAANSCMLSAHGIVLSAEKTNTEVGNITRVKKALAIAELRGLVVCRQPGYKITSEGLESLEAHLESLLAVMAPVIRKHKTRVFGT